MSGKFFLISFLIGILISVLVIFVFLRSSEKKAATTIQNQTSTTSEVENPFIEAPSPTLANPFDEEAGNPFGDESAEDQPYQNPFNQ